MKTGAILDEHMDRRRAAHSRFAPLGRIVEAGSDTNESFHSLDEL